MSRRRNKPQPEDPPQAEIVPPRSGSAQETVRALDDHARALEGVRRLHLDLAQRLEAGDVLRQRVDTVADRVEQLRLEQDRLVRQVRHGRSGLLRTLVTSAAVLVLGVAGGAWLWHAEGDELAPALGLEPPAAGAPMTAGVGVGVGVAPGASGDPAPSAPAGPPLADVERQELLDQVARAEDSVRSAREERNRQMGENARLRQQLLEKDLRFDEYVKTVELAQADAARRVDPGVSTSRTSERLAGLEEVPLVTRLNDAMFAAGLRTLQLVEAGAVAHHRVEDLLLMEHDRQTGGSEILPARAAWLREGQGVVELVVERTEGDGVSHEAHRLPVWDPAHWEGTGLALDTDFLPVGDVAQALNRLLARQSYRLVGLGGFEDGELRDVVVSQVDPDGTVLLTYVAARGEVVREGPELLLHDGYVEEDGEERPFWRGTSRLPLPGADFVAWQKAVR